MALVKAHVEMGDVVAARRVLGNAYFVRNDWATALALFQESLPLCDSAGLSSGRPSPLADIGMTSLELQRHTTADYKR